MFGLPDFITPIVNAAKFFGIGHGVTAPDATPPAPAPSPGESIPTIQKLTPFQWGELAIMFFGLLLTFRLLREVLV